MHIKRLDTFILQTFLPLFAMTFFIVLFIVLMQFLWRYIDDLVGKGLGMGVIAELFFYAAVSMVPMALPLAILLASLMTFGNLGEKFELTAIKASGISLLRAMSPLIILVSAVSVGAFFFQNDVLPRAQVKMWTLLFSMRQKSPELEIPEGVFYDQIPGYNLFVRHKDPETGLLHNVMIYDVSRGGDNATILMGDTARLAMAPDMSHLYLHLTGGEQFENLREQGYNDRNVPFRRESFAEKEIMIPFDANFNRLDEQGMRNQYVGKNISQLQHTIDSVGGRLDSIGQDYSAALRRSEFPLLASTYDGSHLRQPPARLPVKRLLDMDSLVASMGPEKSAMIVSEAKQMVQGRATDLQFRSLVVEEEKKTIRRHGIELHKKFTLSVACIIFFFIGAPLGAIIRKGGLGTPLVISILLFLFYYIIDNTGYKMARDGKWAVWAGIWLSSAILAPLGIYVTWKAMNDSSVFDKDAYLNLLRKIFGARTDRHVAFKEVVIEEVSPEEASGSLAALHRESESMLAALSRCRGYFRYWEGSFPRPQLQKLSQTLEQTVESLTNTKDPHVLSLLPKLPILRILAIYRPTSRKVLGLVMSLFFPLAIPIWLMALRSYRILATDLRQIAELTAMYAAPRDSETKYHTDAEREDGNPA